MTDLTEQQITSLAKLREPFPQAEIRYLPRVWCGTCRDMKGVCKNHQRVKCQKCRNNISSAHIDLAYVGHAEATNRLLNIDPAWDWEPVALDEKGLPQHDQNGGLWIRLTVCGVTRLGYGNAEGKRGGDAVKEIIGDAIRNAGMRFGMALDLWTSSDLEIAENGPKDAPTRLQSTPQASTSPAPDPEPVQEPPMAPVQQLRPVQPGEADQWATSGPQPGEQAISPEQSYADSAGTTTNQAAVKELYRQANAAGLLGATVKVGDETQELGAYLIARGKQLGEPAPKPTPAEEPGEVIEGEIVETGPEDDAAVAEKELRAAAQAVGLDNLDAEFEQSYGIPIAQAPAAQLRQMTGLLTGNAA